MQSVHAIGNEVCTLTRGVLNAKRCHRLIVVAQHIETVYVDENSPTFLIEGSRRKMRYVWDPDE